MIEQWQRARARYEQEGEPPQELEFAVASALRAGERRRQGHQFLRRALSTAAACCASFVLLVNVSPSFARAAERVPVIGQLARLVTVERWSLDDRDHLINVRLPGVELEGHTDLEQRVNAEIHTRINALLDEAENRARAAREAYVATGGTEETFIPITINVDYEIKCLDRHYLSFLVTQTETIANAYTQTFAYNIDLEAGREVSLRDILGPNWQEIANQAVRDGIALRRQEPNQIFFAPGQGGFESVTEDQRFYLNEKGEPVICFDKYEIAPGSMGIQTFPIPIPTKGVS